MCSLGSQTMKNPPCGSWITAIRPTSMTSNAGAMHVGSELLGPVGAASALSTVT